MADGLSAGDHAAYSLHAALVQPERRCHGRCPVRNRLHAPVLLLSWIAPCRIAPPSRISATCSSSINWPSIVQDHQSLAGRSRRRDDPSTLVDATIIEAQLYQEQRAATRSGDASDQERQSVALWHEGPHWCRKEWPDPQPESPPRASMTSISWVICFMERSNLSSRCRLPKAPRARLAEVDVDWLIAERPGRVKP